MEAKDQLLFVYLRNSNAFYDGKRVLIDGSDLFLEYMRKNDYSADLIKKTIAEVTGTRYAIGPYKRKRQEEEARQSAEDVLSTVSYTHLDVYKRQDLYHGHSGHRVLHLLFLYSDGGYSNRL